MSSAPILLVEDNPDDELLTRRALERCGVPCDLVTARSGEEALALLLGSGNGSAPASHPNPVVVLLDLKLPGIHGTEVLRRLRASDRTRFLPVIVLSSSRAPQDVDSCYALGASSYLQKPVDFDEFQESVEILARYWLRMNVPPTSNS